MLNLDFSFYRWDLISTYVLKGFYFSMFLTFVATLGAALGLSDAQVDQLFITAAAL